MPKITSGHYHSFVGRALYKDRETYVRINLQTSGSVETPSLDFLCQLLNQSVQNGRRVLLTKKPNLDRKKHPEKTLTLRAMLRACDEIEMQGSRISVSENPSVELKPRSYETLTPDQMLKLKEMWETNYASNTTRNPFSYQP